VLNEIKQSVLLFNQKGDLVYFNLDAKKELGITEDALMKPLYYQIRSAEIKDAVTKAIQNKDNYIFDVKIDGSLFEVKIFYIAINPSFDHDTAILALIKDVTTERKVDQMKRDFFAHASHELKSPLTAIKGHAELISHQMLKKEEIIDSAERITLQVEMMTALVEDMLILSRLENLTDEKHQFNQIHHIVLESIDQLSTFAENKNIKIHSKLDDVEFECDEIDMNKMFKNVIENAIKYSKNDSKIDVILKKEKDTFKFTVKDRGIGIPKEHQQKVFERFYRVDKGRLDGGTGLGLAIVKHVVIKYKGTIDLVSKSNEGTTITIEIPI
jgi:two-component system phosphate regulon sensor histidine kinase PhoR